MEFQSRHLSVHIDRPAATVYEFASDPANLPRWASGLGASFACEDGQWVADSPMGRVTFEFAPCNEFGVLDHDVTLPSGQVVYNPMRAIPAGAGCEVLFTLRRQPGMTDEAFESDARAVADDLATLKDVLEGR